MFVSGLQPQYTPSFPGHPVIGGQCDLRFVFVQHEASQLPDRPGRTDSGHLIRRRSKEKLDGRGDQT